MSERMPRTDLPGYFKGLSQRLDLQVKLMTPVIVHSGEMGDNDHGWFAHLLRQYLPHKYGVGTGFVVNTESDKGSATFFDTSEQPRTQDPFISPQMDILIQDVLHNAPFCAEHTFSVCPIEMVLGAVEVTRDLDKSKLASDCAKLSKVKALASDKAYSPENVGARMYRPFTFAVGLGGNISQAAIYEVYDSFERPLRPDAVFLLGKALYWFPRDGTPVYHIPDDTLYQFIALVRRLVDRMPVGGADLHAYLPFNRIIEIAEVGRADDSASLAK